MKMKFVAHVKRFSGHLEHKSRAPHQTSDHLSDTYRLSCKISRSMEQKAASSFRVGEIQYFQKCIWVSTIWFLAASLVCDLTMNHFTCHKLVHFSTSQSPWASVCKIFLNFLSDSRWDLTGKWCHISTTSLLRTMEVDLIVNSSGPNVFISTNRIAWLRNFLVCDSSVNQPLSLKDPTNDEITMPQAQPHVSCRPFQTSKLASLIVFMTAGNLLEWMMEWIEPGRETKKQRLEASIDTKLR